MNTILLCPHCGTSFYKKDLKPSADENYYCPKVGCKRRQSLLDVPACLRRTVKELQWKGCVITKCDAYWSNDMNDFEYQVEFSRDGFIPTSAPDGWHYDGNVPATYEEDGTFHAEYAVLVSDINPTDALKSIEGWAQEL